jgi:serine-type D-Ala-D-Ala carboxypeptidase (penicillin-binding protein 5/6)
VSRKRKPRRPAFRGLFARFCALLLGAAIAGGLVVGLQLPLLHQVSTARVTLSVIKARPGTVNQLAWPSVGSAAIVIPGEGVAQSWHNEVVPIASLTKLMTAYVVLKQLPLGVGQTGPCISVSESDVADYEALSAQDESSVYVVQGETLCESDLLDGLLVHSASNYADLLANMVSGTTTAFIARMNATAASMGLTGTHYVDVSGFDPGSVSTALDQAKLAIQLMKSPLVRSIVDLPDVTLPVAGTVDSFTPYVGVDNVVGVKSGRTAAAGGCDVMAMTYLRGTRMKTLYAVVLGQQGGDLLGPAGDAALALAQSALKSQLPHSTRFRSATSWGTLGWGARRVSFGLRSAAQVAWPNTQSRLRIRVHVRSFTSTVHRGEIVGWLRVYGLRTHRFLLVAKGQASPLTLWQRIR